MSKRIWNRIKREGFINEIRRLRVKFLFLKKDVYNFLGLNHPKYVKSFYGPLMFENWKDVTFRFCVRGSQLWYRIFRLPQKLYKTILLY
jgi:hypothetical protein